MLTENPFALMTGVCKPRSAPTSNSSPFRVIGTRHARKLARMSVLFVLLFLIGLLAAAAFLSKTSLLSRALTTPAFDIGAPVVYQRQEVSTHPVANALNVRPSERGEFYYYSLVNYLRVTHVLDDGRIIAITRDNKRLCLSPNDSQLRKAHFTERFIYRGRFPHRSA
jgi:hypothetical protein